MCKKFLVNFAGSRIETIAEDGEHATCNARIFRHPVYPTVACDPSLPHTINMPAPTALKAPPAEDAALTTPLPDEIQDEDLLDAAAAEPSASFQPTDSNAMQLDDAMDEEGRPRFAPASKASTSDVVRIEHRKVPIPPHRMTPLKAAWPKIYPPLVEHLKLQCRMNMKSKAVELRTSKVTTDTGAIQKGADFVRAFALGFDVDDAIALLRLDDLYIESMYLSPFSPCSNSPLPLATDGGARGSVMYTGRAPRED